jgi:3-oxoacyl-[acyl-carrier protein] reductase
MNLDLTHKNALVCGASKGIGRAIAMELAAMGANVTVASRNEAALVALVASLPNKDQKHQYLVLDTNDTEQLSSTIKQFASTTDIHILVNNTGGPAGGPITEAAPEAFVQAFANHILASHVIAKAVIPSMKTAHYGRIINIISTSVKQPIDGLGVSNTTRAAMANWAKTMANELAPFGITVNNVLPGPTDTERLTAIHQAESTKKGISFEAAENDRKSKIPMGRFGTAEEVAAAAAFLASPAASFITGINLPVDGGITKNL